jgi:hypothetical protein
VEAYELVLTEAAAMVFAAARTADQRRLVWMLEALKIAPFRPGDFQERDAHGRVNEVRLTGDWLITYWADHATRELRIMRLERVED